MLLILCYVITCTLGVFSKENMLQHKPCKNGVHQRQHAHHALSLADTLHVEVWFCRDADLLLVANKGGFAFAVDPDSGEKLWATAVGKASTTAFTVLHSSLVGPQQPHLNHHLKALAATPDLQYASSCAESGHV